MLDPVAVALVKTLQTRPLASAYKGMRHAAVDWKGSTLPLPLRLLQQHAPAGKGRGDTPGGAMARGDKQRFVSCNKHVSVLEESRNPIVRFAPRIIAPALLPLYVCAIANVAMVRRKCERSFCQILLQQEIYCCLSQKCILFFILFVLVHSATDSMLTVFKAHCIIYHLGGAQFHYLTKLLPQLNRFKQKGSFIFFA